jgi:hypothetical protein
VLAGRPTFRVEDVSASLCGLRAGMGFILWVSEGVADTLEGFTFDEVLPRDWQIVELRYSNLYGTTDPPIQRPAKALRRPDVGITSEVRESPPPYPRP